CLIGDLFPGEVLDGVGNLCDADLDGDGEENTIDNCPDIGNPDQADLDGDGIGNACESDTDGDAVPDVEDNCLWVVNPGQGDSDADLLGDACDADDDNDSIADELDNCAVTYNPFQDDFDDDGEGDACDGDADGDSIANEIDTCPESSLGLQVNDQGCTGPQFIGLQCPRDNFVQHGQYVSCIAHAANEAVEQTLLLEHEKAVFIREAAKMR
ncbi:MAG: thrombospondin type 3 repeat-containing protein, partial [Desulfobacterales bacterium]